MLRLLLALAIVAFANPYFAFSQENAAALRAEKPELSPVERLKADPNDVEALNKYLGAEINGAYDLIEEKKFEDAEAKLKAAGEFIDSLKPTETAARNLKLRFPLFRSNALFRLEVARTPLEDLKQKLEAKLDDSAAFRSVLMKYSTQISPLTGTEPEQAESMVVEAKAYFDSIKEKNPENEALKKLLAGAEATFKSLQRTIDAEKTHRALIGQRLPSLNAAIRDWANGNPLTDDDLHGKVVMLDFWAVWCGPCIATFPHLREWKAKYGAQDFEIVGVTQYYNFKWDADNNKAVYVKKEPIKVAAETEDSKVTAETADAKVTPEYKPDTIVSPEEERNMLEHFASLHELTHPFAVQDKEATLAKHFAVLGIPTAVVIDRKGIIRLIRVGSGDENAHDIEQMIEKLIHE
jgi:thiol-disulfide isomerase/thioredoxin